MSVIPNWQTVHRDGSWGSASVRWCAAAVVALAVHGLAVWFSIRDEPATELDLRPEPLAGMDISVAAPDAPAAPDAASSRRAAAEPEPEGQAQPPAASGNVVPPDPAPVRPAPLEALKKPPAPVAAPVSVPVRSPSIMPNHELEPSPFRRASRRDDERPRPREPRRFAHSEDRPSRTTRAGPNARMTGSTGAPGAAIAQGSSPVRVSPAAWQGAVLAHLDRFKRSPGGGSGVATVAFNIDRGGHVLSARLVGSAGNSTLDAEAVSLPRRASPVPSPPAGVGSGSVLSLTVPIRFK